MKHKKIVKTKRKKNPAAQALGALGGKKTAEYGRAYYQMIGRKGGVARALQAEERRKAKQTA